jgi:hypothetical protein
MTIRTRRLRRKGLLALLGGGAIVLAAGAAMAFADGGNLNVEVANRLGYATANTNDGAKVEYIGDLNTTFGSSGSGVFDAFVRLQGDTQESGYNTDGDREFDTKAGTFTHSILVSDIPVISVGGAPHWELWADINDSDSTPLISLNELEIYFTDDPELSGYSFGTDADKVYDFFGSIHINDVNQGSGRGDLRYSIPTAGLPIPPECSYKNPACDTYFVLYSQWGAPSGSYTSDGGFEEWKVKEYPYVTVSKTAATTFTRTFPWSIDKSVTPDEWDLFTNESGTSDYTVTLTKGTGVDSGWAVSGTITIDNPSPDDAVITSVADVISVGLNATVSCGVSFPYTLENGDDLECSYSRSLPDGTSRTNTATVTLDYGGLFTGSAAVTFGTPTTLVNDTVHVTDTFEGSLGAFSASGSATYDRTFTCDGDEDTHGNTATITETGQSASASVTVACHEIEVSKTAETSYTRTFEWTISKSADPSTWDLFTGDSGTSDWTVGVTKTGHTDSDFHVEGDILVENNTPIDATVNSVSDMLTDGAATVDCGDAVFPYTLLAGADLACTYEFDPADADDQSNEATAVRQNYDYDSSGVGTADDTTDIDSGPVDVDFGEPTTLVNASITVTDDNGLSKVASGTDSWTYPETFTCDADEGKHDNTARITETGQTASASVTVNCHELTVTKDADESFDRKYTWEIDKTGESDPVTVPVDETATISYEVTVDVTGSTDSDWAVEGDITVHNPAPIAATINSVSDVISGVGAAAVDCGSATFPYTLAAGGDLECTYSSDLPNADTRTNTATATRQNYSYASDGTGTADGTTDVSGSASVNFAGATMTETDECIDVSDSLYGDLGTVCVGDDLPAVFTYEWTVGPYGTCGERTVDNTASFITNDTGATGDADWTVDVVVIGCGNLFHTGTTCDQFLGNDPPVGLAGQGIEAVDYSVRRGLISQVNPGVFFYYNSVTAAGGSITLDVNQIPPASYPNPMAVFQHQVLVYDENCNTYASFTATDANGDVHLVINGTTAGDDYIFSVKYTPGNLVGLAPPATNTVPYSWRTEIGASIGGEDSLDFVKKQGGGSAGTLSTTTATTTPTTSTTVDSTSAQSVGESATETSHGRSADHPTPQGKGKQK